MSAVCAVCAQDLVRRMLRVDPSVRASVPEIFSHVWMRTSSSSYDPSTSTTRERDLISPLSLLQKQQGGGGGGGGGLMNNATMRPTSPTNPSDQIGLNVKGLVDMGVNPPFKVFIPIMCESINFSVPPPLFMFITLSLPLSLLLII